MKHYLVDVYDSNGNLTGHRPVNTRKIEGYVERARKEFEFDIDLRDFAIIGGKLCIDSKLPEEFFDDLS